MTDGNLFRIALAVVLIPLLAAIIATAYQTNSVTFRYPCQDPSNWDKDFCKPPICDVTRTCPEHIFKNQKDPRLGPPKEGEQTSNTPSIILPTEPKVTTIEKGCK